MNGESLTGLILLCAAATGWLFWLHARRQNARLRAERARLEREADLDPLTGAFQHRAFRRTASAGKAPLQGCVFCDLNNLKTTNDTFGHMEGDRLIRAAADAIRAAAEGRGSLFRIGGDEFLYLPDEGAPSVAELCRRIDAAVAKRNAAAAIPLSLAVGGAVPAPGEDWEPLIQAAEREMYRDKRQKKQVNLERGEGGNRDD